MGSRYAKAESSKTRIASRAWGFRDVGGLLLLATYPAEKTKIAVLLANFRILSPREQP